MFRSSLARNPVLPAFSRRFVTLFMVLLAVPALMLLWLNVNSLRRLWFPDARTGASSSMSAEQLASALERRVSELALQALLDGELQERLGARLDGVSQLQQFRSATEHVRQRHPIVKDIFVVRNGAVVFPREAAGKSGEADMTRALQQALRRPVSARRTESVAQQIAGSPELYALAFASQENYQSYYRNIVQRKGQTLLLGLTVDLDWLQQTVCPDLGIGDEFELGYTRDAVAPAVSTPFKTAFPFWKLRPTTAAARQSAAHVETMVAMSSEVLAAILCFGLFALHRHVAREREMIRMRSDFVSGVSHELKTPITVIRLYSETLMESPDVRPEGREYCEIISYEAQRLDRLVEGVLNVSAIERGFKAYSFKECDIGGLTTQTLAHIRRYYHYKGYTLSEDIARDLPAVKVDGEAFKSALLNLVDNAIKYSNSSHVVRVCVYRAGASVVVAVEDYGIGIAPEAVGRIFDPFYRAENASVHGGCGLGLYLVRHIMTAHGGSVRVESKLGAGSRFELAFPASRKRETSDPRSVPERTATLSAQNSLTE